ncbi:hypothetical protein [Streptomyces sannanensis]|uniref:hypothetical protein n=1 Tax=Streptomyces sannanensis TaxID=285536 RepID=UPI0031EE66D8
MDNTRSAEPSVSASPSGPGSPERSDYTFRLPIAAYSYSDAEYAVIESAQLVLAKKCAARFSLAYRPPGTAPAPPSASDRRYGLSSAAEAARFGYRMPPQPAPVAEKLDADTRLVLYGRRAAGGATGPLEYRGQKVPETGCLGEAIKTFDERYEYPAGVEAARTTAVESYRESLKDARVRAAIGDWSGCMKLRGFDYASPMDSLGSPSFREGRISAEEKETAVADVTCKLSTNLLETWFSAESDIQSRMIDKNSKVLQKLREVHRKKLQEAERIVADA